MSWPFVSWSWLLELRADVLAHRSKPARADHDVIDDVDPDDLADLVEAVREGDVLGARPRIAARVVVHEHAGARRHAHERPEHLARVHVDARDRAARDLHDLEQAAAHVEPDREEHLLLQTREP